MPSLGGCTLSRRERGVGVVRLALVCLLPFASCAPPDLAGPEAGLQAPGPSASLVIGPAPQFFVSPTGSPSGDGSLNNPWDLATALEGPAAVTPGSTIWLRGGTYTDGPYFGHGYLSNLTGTADAPIVVRQFPGERATVTKFLRIAGAHTWFWGFEIVHPPPHVGPALGIDTRGPGTKLINLLIHDASASGIFIGPEATDAEVHGSISFNNGRTRLDHGIYCQSQTSTRLTDNIVFGNWAYGVHCFALEEGRLRNIDLEGNVAFNNDVWDEPSAAEVLVGGHEPASGITIKANYTYRTNFTNTMTAEIGHGAFANQDLVFTDNYLIGGWWYLGVWATATVTDNTLYNFTTGGMVWNRGDLSGHTWSGNQFFGDPTTATWRYGSDNAGLTTLDSWRTLTGLTDPGRYAGNAPAGVKTVVRPNRYEPGRANIIVYNWAHQGTVSVDVSRILDPGDHYVVQHAQDFYGAPVASGTYAGGLIELPMVRITPPALLGTVTAQPAPVTGPTFNAFVLMKRTPWRVSCAVWDADPGSCGPRRSSPPR